MCQNCGHPLSGHVNGECYCIVTLYTVVDFQTWPCPCGKGKVEPEISKEPKE